jgi:DNA-binding NarL/FixJ family response regulator
VEEKIKILIADDHPILRAGLRTLLSAEARFQVVGDAADGLEAIRRVETLNPDLVLIDLSMPRMNGCTAIREIKKKHPHIRMLVLTIHKSEEYILAASRAGADGYCLKDVGYPELLACIERILSRNLDRGAEFLLG